MIANQVEYILMKFPHTRDSDRELVITLWQTYYPTFFYENNWLNIHKFFDLPNHDTITRARRKLKDKYPRSKEIEQQCAENEDMMRNTMAREGWQWSLDELS
jgi:hypothetical protein